MTNNNERRENDHEPFYRIVPARDGLVEVWLSEAMAVPAEDDLTGRTDYNFRIWAVTGVDPNDPQWEGNLEEHIRRHYYDWVKSAEVIEL